MFKTKVVEKIKTHILCSVTFIRKSCRYGIKWNNASQPPGRGPMPGPGISYIGPREILLELISNLNVILYLSTCHTVFISVLIFFMIMLQLIINAYFNLMYEFKKNGKVFTSKSVGNGPSSCEKRIYRAAV